MLAIRGKDGRNQKMSKQISEVTKRDLAVEDEPLRFFQLDDRPA